MALWPEEVAREESRDMGFKVWAWIVDCDSCRGVVCEVECTEGEADCAGPYDRDVRHDWLREQDLGVRWQQAARFAGLINLRGRRDLIAPHECY